MVDAKTLRRNAREKAIKLFNGLALSLELDAIPVRASPEDVAELYETLCEHGADEHVEKIAEARTLWMSNGGSELNEEPLIARVASQETRDEEAASAFPGGEEPVRGHHRVHTASGKEFRIRARAFMLTFNCLAFVAEQSLFLQFEQWLEERRKHFGATCFSACMEESTQAVEEGRVHLHAYLSWHAAGSKGIDHTSTQEWRFKGVKPRVDTNTEARSAWQWLRATQHGHFYVQIMKEGTLWSSSNYWAWVHGWVPEAAWATSLWRQHKLSHQAYLRISIKLRENHDRRKAMVDAVVAAEAAEAYVEEQKAARALIASRRRPFKPMPSEISSWMLQYHIPEERYKMLVLHGPSCTGKSKLGRSLYGESDTLVVDVQGAQHPDLKSFVRGRHKAVLLDEVASPAFVISNKKLLQAHVDGALLGQSATQLYSYFVFLWRVPIILTTNNWDYSAFTEADKNWLDTNCVAVHIGTRVWHSAASTPVERSGKRVWRSPEKHGSPMDEDNDL